MKLPDHFLRYFMIATGFLILGILIVIIQTAALNPGLGPFDAVELQAQARYHTMTVMPFMAAVFPQLLFLNTGVALFILLLSLFWIRVWWFRKDLSDATIIFMQGTVCLLRLAPGHNSFTKVSVTCRLLPPPVIAAI
jgi:hypothetical protein